MEIQIFFDDGSLASLYGEDDVITKGHSGKTVTSKRANDV